MENNDDYTIIVSNYEHDWSPWLVEKSTLNLKWLNRLAKFLKNTEVENKEELDSLLNNIISYSTDLLAFSANRLDLYQVNDCELIKSGDSNDYESLLKKYNIITETIHDAKDAFRKEIKSKILNYLNEGKDSRQKIFDYINEIKSKIDKNLISQFLEAYDKLVFNEIEWGVFSARIKLILGNINIDSILDLEFNRWY